MKKAIDTNVLLRSVIDDGSRQSAMAAELVRTEDVYVPATVQLEFEWVLRSVIGIDRHTTNGVFSTLLGMGNVAFEGEERLRMAVIAHRDGMDFADAMHLLASAGCSAFVTFNKDLSNRAARLLPDFPVTQPQ